MGKKGTRHFEYFMAVNAPQETSLLNAMLRTAPRRTRLGVCMGGRGLSLMAQEAKQEKYPPEAGGVSLAGIDDTPYHFN